MPSERIARCFRDILGAIALIETWAREAGGAEAAISDTKTRSAIERQLLVMSEAAIRLHHLDAAFASSLAPDIDWPGVRGMGNFIRHKYDDIDLDVVTDVLNNRLAALKAASLKGLAATDS